MGERVSVRQAVEADRDFLIEAILAAERGGAPCLSYCEIFGVGEDELRGLLGQILAEDFEGQELCTSGFLVALDGDEYAGAACGWIEGEAELPSTLIKANLLHHFLGAERVAHAKPWFGRLEALAIAREPGAAQLESIYVRAASRGRGVLGSLLGEQMARMRARDPKVDKAQIILVRDNDAARRAYEKLGFRTVAERRTDDPALFPIVPGGVKILMEKRLSESQPMPGESRT
jgi:ribosomal protein S18 acetylase RimI-like enzyme